LSDANLFLMTIANKTPLVLWVKSVKVTDVSMVVAMTPIVDLKKLASTKSVRIHAASLALVVLMPLANHLIMIAFALVYLITLVTLKRSAKDFFLHPNVSLILNVHLNTSAKTNVAYTDVVHQSIVHQTKLVSATNVSIHVPLAVLVANKLFAHPQITLQSVHVQVASEEILM